MTLDVSFTAREKAATLFRVNSFIWGFHGQVLASTAEPILCTQWGQQKASYASTLSIRSTPCFKKAAPPQTSPISPLVSGVRYYCHLLFSEISFDTFSVTVFRARQGDPLDHTSEITALWSALLESFLVTLWYWDPPWLALSPIRVILAQTRAHVDLCSIYSLQGVLQLRDWPKVLQDLCLWSCPEALGQSLVPGE